MRLFFVPLCLCVSVFHRPLRERKNRQHAALVAEAADVRKSTDRAERCRRIFAANVGCDTDTRPAADTREHSDVLFTIGSGIGHRITNDSGWGLELPQNLAGFSMNGFKPSFHGSVKNHVSTGGESASPGGEVFFHAPVLLS